MVIDEHSDTGQLRNVYEEMKEGQSMKEAECYPNRCPVHDFVTPFDDFLSARGGAGFIPPGSHMGVIVSLSNITYKLDILQK